MSRLVLGLALALSTSACGGIVVFEGSGGSGGEGGATSTTDSATVGVTTSTGTAGCTAHDQCPGQACIFTTGQCADVCNPDFACGTCGPGTVCDGCGTSSCPGCKDCLAVCAPTPAGRCDDDDPCPPGEVCLFQSGQCAPACDVAGGCADPNQICDGCATGSCCGCEDCVSACVFGDF